MSLTRADKLFLMLVCLLLAACSSIKHLPKGEKLYTGAEVKVKSMEKVDKGSIKSAAEEAIRPIPNKSFLGMRPKLWKYYMAGENPHTKLQKWFKKRGEAPVLLSDVKPGVTSQVIDARLFNMGIFKSITQSKTEETKRTAKVIYTCYVHKPFKIKDLSYDISDDSISRLVLAEKKKSLIKPGKKYSLDNLKNERVRLDAILKNHGYFYFSPDNLLFKADTSNLNHTVAFTLALKDSLPEKALKVYHIGYVNVNQNYTLNEQRKLNPLDTLMLHDIVFFGKAEKMAVRPRVLSKSIYLRPEEVFSRQNHIITLSRLMSMGNYKLVQVNFSENKDSLPGLLDVNILMTPMRKRTFRAEIDLVSKSNNYTGPRLNLSLINRNTFGGAELLNLNLAGSFEAQFSNKSQYSYSWNPQLELTFPRFLVPFHLKSSNSIFVPKTSILFSYNYQKRVQYFDMNTFRFVYGFKWKENIRKEHELNPIDISFTTVGNKTVAFNDTLEAHPFLKRSYDEQFIAGGSYTFTYSEQMLTGKKLQNYIQLSSELAGNSFSLVKKIEGKTISPDNPNKVVGSIYSQYGKMSVDGRTYLNFKNKNKMALRLFAGVAKPYGNSSIMPYTKQFFSGGPNSIRAFHINSVGPGTYLQDPNQRGFLQLGGEVKLEADAEYRFGIYRFFKGALFVDSGNVWLLKSNPSNIGSPFVLSNALDEFAVGAGVGIRIDVSFFILRFDLAMPLRKPWLEENNRWVVNQIDFRSSTWRSDNLVLNVAIGYPF